MQDDPRECASGGVLGRGGGGHQAASGTQSAHRSEPSRSGLAPPHHLHRHGHTHHQSRTG